MSFSAFSKDFTANMFTSVENQFITRYLPWADGDAVRVYLYGLYLCSCKEEFDADSAAKLLKLDRKRFEEIFGFWEECGLVQILSKDPFFVEYLPVSGAVGKPKPIQAEKYAEFNRELLKLLQKVGKDFKHYEYQKIIEFLEESRMEQQAFLLTVEYCIKKDGERLSFAHVINKAKKFVSENKFTYEQILHELADFNLHEHELEQIFSALGIFRKPQENDFKYLENWLSLGMEPDAILECASALKKGTLVSLDVLVRELIDRQILSLSDAKQYLSRRALLTDIVYSVARKLGTKVENPGAYSEEYARKWLDYGFSRESLVQIAGLCFKLGYGFPEMDSIVDSLRAQGSTENASVKDYVSTREKSLRLLGAITSECGIVKKSLSALDLIAAWKSWGFSDEMILEAARRSASASAPLMYMNKLLSEWKRIQITQKSEIPARKTDPENKIKSEAAIAADLRSEREHYYAVLRQNAFRAADEARARAEQEEKFRSAESDVRKYEIELARAEVYTPSSAEQIKRRLLDAKNRRSEILRSLHLSERDLEPKFHCVKCSDTGFLPDGKMCDCYPKEH